MPPQDPKRKLTAILSADVAGSSLLMRDEEATVSTSTDYRMAMASLIQQYGGHSLSRRLGIVPLANLVNEEEHE